MAIQTQYLDRHGPPALAMTVVVLRPLCAAARSAAKPDAKSTRRRNYCTIVHMIIADTNIFLAVALEEPERDQIIEATRGKDIAAPEILPYELGNALTAMYKRRQLSSDQVGAVHGTISRIPVRLMTVDIQEALHIALQFNLYAYDAYFIQCARACGVPLMTLDQRMHRVASEIGIAVPEGWQ